MRKNNKRALIVSGLSLLLCVSMLVGSTMAWFTDTATTNVNTIKAGELKLKLEMLNPDTKEWEDAEGKKLEFVKNTGAQGVQVVLWEPGCTYELPQLRISNAGNLALKFKLDITGIDGDAKLNEAIEWKYDYSYTGIEDWGNGPNEFPATKPATALDGGLVLLPADDPKVLKEGWASYYNLVISGHMDEKAGNEYQGLSIETVAITINATQMDHEVDSYNAMYDMNAEYSALAATQKELDTVLKTAKPGDTVALSAGATYEISNIPENVNIDANGATIAIPEGTDKFSRVYGNDSYISNAVITGSNIVTSGSVAFDNCTFKGNLSNAVPADNVSFNNCTFDADVHFASGSGAEVPTSNFYATDCTFNKGVTLADFGTVTFKNCEFKGSNWAGTNLITYSPATFDTCTFASENGIRLAEGMTADAITLINTTTNIKLYPQQS